MQISNKADCSVLWWKVLHSNAPLGVLPILAFLPFLFWWRNFQLHVICLLIFFFCFCVGLITSVMSSSFFPARSLELVRMAPFGDGMKWIMRAPKTEASAAALPPLASCSVVVSIMVVQNCNLVVLKSGEWLLTECSMFGCWLLCFECCNLEWLRCYIAPWTSYI